MLANRVKETTATTGTGTFSLDGAVTGHRTFLAAFGTGNRCYYCIEAGADYEIGEGTVTSGSPNTLTRDRIILSTNGNNAVVFGAGSKFIFNDIPAEVLNTLSYIPIALVGLHEDEDIEQEPLIDNCQLYRSSLVTVVTATPTVLGWDAESFDGNGLHSLVTNPSRITIKKAGVYLLVSKVNWDTNATGNRIQRFKKNGSTISSLTLVANAEEYNFLYFASLAVGDYVELEVEQDSGVNLDLAATDTQFGLCLLGVSAGDSAHTAGAGITIDSSSRVHAKQDITDDTDGATITFDMALSNQHKVTLGGNRILALSNVTTGQKFLIRLKQDGTGSRTVTWFSGISWEGGTTPTLTTTANKADWFGFICTGSNTYDGFILGKSF